MEFNSGQLTRKKSDCFWKLDGWRTYWHDYCRTQTTPISVFLSILAFPLPRLWKRQQQLWLGFIQLFPLSFHLLLSLCSSHSFLYPFFLYQTTLSFTYPSLCVYPACLCSKCTYCPCLPLLPSPLTPEQFPAVPHTQGPVCTREEKKKKLLCYQRRRSMHFISI